MKYVIGALAVTVWQWVGVGVTLIWRRDLAEEAATGWLNAMLWPGGVIAQGVVWPIVKWRKERQRQRRITAKVATGEVAADYARRTLSWKG